MLTLYPELVAQEEKSRYAVVTEKHLQMLWLEQTFFQKLKTVEDEEIEVISPGIWNREAGPDFLRAHLRIGKTNYRGDIEIHLFDEGWYQHGHHLDSRYNQVILHISYWHLPRSNLINKENGQQPFSCYLENSLSIPLDRIITLIDLDFYPDKEFASRGRCSEQLFQLLPDNKIKELLQSAATWRIERKLTYLEQNCPGNRSLQFAGGIAMALGYQHNARAFFELFLYLMPYRDLVYEELLAIALGCCGFLEQGRPPHWEESSYYQYLRSLWWGRKDQMTHQAHLKLNRIRPLHHPIRRLAHLTHFLQDPCFEQLWHYTVQLCERAMNATNFNVKQLQRDLLEALPSYSDPYWDYHFTFESKAQSSRLPGLGKELKMHILLNTILPLLYATIKESKNFQHWEKFQQFYAMLEIPLTSKSRYLHHRLFSLRKDQEFLTKAQMAQGAYQLHQDFCTHFEASCQGCPFVERYLSRFSILEKT